MIETIIVSKVTSETTALMEQAIYPRFGVTMLWIQENV